MHLAVVIPTLNASAELPQTLAMLGRVPAEVVVADGGSSDGTMVVAAAAGARAIRAPRGRGSQLCSGIAATTAPWLLLLHADTHLSTGWVQAARDHAARYAGQAGYFRFTLRSGDPRARRVERLVAWRCRTFALPYGDQGLLIARSLLEQIGGVRPLVLMEDVDLVWRLGRGRLRPLDAAAATSAIRWEQDGWNRRSLRNLLCLSLWVAGVPAARVARLYA